MLCDEEWIQLRLTERVRRIRDQGPPAPATDRARAGRPLYDYEPTGELSLELTNVTAPGVRTKWKESKKQRLEDLLSEFIAYLPTVALSFKLEREEEERRADCGARGGAAPLRGAEEALGRRGAPARGREARAGA